MHPKVDGCTVGLTLRTSFSETPDADSMDTLNMARTFVVVLDCLCTACIGTSEVGTFIS